MLEKVRTALRLRNTELDGEIQDMIDACKVDLSIAGIVTISEDDPLIIRATILYCKANFSFTTENIRFQQSYDMLKCSLQLSAKYTTVVV